MKQLLYCLICITQIFFMSCNESVLNTNEPDNKISPHSQVIKTMDEAISIAIDAAERLYPTKSRGASRSALKTNVKSITNPFQELVKMTRCYTLLISIMKKDMQLSQLRI